jgi:UDP-N-acetylglucosamine acyltransferase
VGNRACIYGVNGLGLVRRGFTSEQVSAIRQAYRVLLQSRLNTSAALTRLQSEGPHTADVQTILEFIRSSKRGVILKRHHRRNAPDGDE